MHPGLSPLAGESQRGAAASLLRLIAALLLLRHNGRRLANEHGNDRFYLLGYATLDELSAA